MSEKTYVPDAMQEPSSQIGATFEALATTIKARRDGGENSYTYSLLNSKVDELLKKIIEEAGEIALAAKDVEHSAGANKVLADEDIDHLRYEAGDLVYHLLVLLERYHIPLEEFAAELNMRMTEEERPDGAVRLHDSHIKRGK